MAGTVGFVVGVVNVVSVVMDNLNFRYPSLSSRLKVKFRQLVLRDSPWDPLKTKLPMREQVSAYLWWPIFLDRSVTLSDPLDPEGFLPFADTISGSRWPGSNGAPPREG